MEVLGICLPYVKMYFQEHHLSTFFFMGQITQILLFSGILLLERSKITVREQHFFKKKIVMEVLGLHLPYIKRYFQKDQLSVSYFMAQITQILLFSGILLLERSKITVRERHLFKINCYGSFGSASTLHKKVFSEAPVKCVLLYGSNNSDSVVFRNAAFREIKNHSLRMTPFQNKICYGSFGFVCTLYKKVFSGAPFKCVFLYGSNKSDSVVFGNADFAVIKYHSLSTIDF